MSQKFTQDDRCDVALGGKLGKYRDRRASARVLEIDRVHQVAGQGDAIGDDKQPPQHLVEARALLDMERQEHEHKVDAVDVEQRRCVKHQRAAQHGLEQGPRHIGREGRPVLGKEGHPREHPHQVGNQHIECGGADVAMDDSLHIIHAVSEMIRLDGSWRASAR